MKATRLGCITAALLLACSGGADLGSAPRFLAGLEIHHEINGPRALEAVRRLHGETPIEIVNAWLAQYGTGPSAMLYVGTARDGEKASQIVEAMGRRIAEDETPFHGIRPANLFGSDLYTMAGQGQFHFLFQIRDRVVWLSADPPVACRALAEALSRHADSSCELWLDSPARRRVP
ncbi:MAG: hypothetical protein GTO22_10160 [Gemmatimonadales bacterium]|nr:hypothetical protein [Gemmatimonadales bacterium]